MGRIDVDLNSEKGIISREKGPFLRVKVARAGTMGNLRWEGGPHLHELMTSGWGGEAELSLAVEVEFTNEVESCISAGRALWWGDGGHC